MLTLLACYSSIVVLEICLPPNTEAALPKLTILATCLVWRFWNSTAKCRYTCGCLTICMFCWRRLQCIHAKVHRVITEQRALKILSTRLTCAFVHWSLLETSATSVSDSVLRWLALAGCVIFNDRSRYDTTKWNWNKTVSKLFRFSFIALCGQFIPHLVARVSRTVVS